MIYEQLKEEFGENNYLNILNASMIKDDNKIYDLIKDFNDKQGSDFQFLVCCLSDECFLKYIANNLYLVTEDLFPRICKINDELLKIYYLNVVSNDKLYIMLALSLKDPTLRDKFMANVDDKTLKSVILYLRNRELLLRLLPYIYDRDEDFYHEIKPRIQKNSLIIYKALMQSILDLKDKNEKLSMLKKYYFVDGLCRDVLKNTKDGVERRFLINNLFEIKGREIYTSLYDKHFDIKDYASALPKILTFGVEIECFGDLAWPILFYDKNLRGYCVKDELSLPDGLEFTSPKLSWNRDDLQSLYQICDFARINNLRCFNRSGGHIHFGSDYLDTRDAWYWFFYLYTKFEMIIYKILNSRRESPRKGIMNNAMPFSKTYVDNYDSDYENLGKDEFIKKIQNLFCSRFIGINLSNIFVRFNTIEFRMPNGTLEADEIILRILLIGNLMVAAKRLSGLHRCKNDYDLLLKLDSCDDERELLEIMLDLLFQSEYEKSIFRERYADNCNIENEEILASKMKTFSFIKKGIKI